LLPLSLLLFWVVFRGGLLLASCVVPIAVSEVEN
jgi:hypothetical protein